MAFNLFEFNSIDELNQVMAGRVSELLSAILKNNAHATLAVSGGSTPAPFFQVLSQQAINWHDITVTLVDERCVSPGSPDSNTTLVKEKLLINKAKTASFFPFVHENDSSPDPDQLESQFLDKASLPLSLTILGMGTDGHTASLFPCAPTIQTLMNEDPQALFHLVEPVSAPYKRISFSLSALLQSKHIILHIVGKNKKLVLEEAINGTDSLEMPIRAFLHHPGISIDIYWAPNQGETK